MKLTNGTVADVREKVAAVRRLHQTGLIDLRRPRRIKHMIALNNSYGPQAAMISAGATDRPDEPAPADERGVLTYRELDEHGGVVMIATPVFHTTGMGTWTIASALGAEIVLRRRFDAEATLSAIERHSVEMLVAVPTQLNRILALGPDIIARYNTSTLRTVFVGGAPLPPDLAIRWQDAFGDVLYNGYGSTEVAITAVAQPHELRRAPGTVGRAPVTARIALYDSHDRRITGANVSGRIFARTVAPFEGYTDGKTEQIIDGYMSTGDMGHFDAGGLLFIDGRDDDTVVCGGENVYPLEVENLLAGRADVADVAVIGVDDVDFGQRLRAFIVAATDVKPDAQEIKNYVKDNLARYKVPRDVVFLDEMPRNPTGKIVRKTLTEYVVDGPVGR